MKSSLNKFTHNKDMPFRFSIEVRQSEIQGKGLFALQDIPKGSKIWTIDFQQGWIPLKGYDNPQQYQTFTVEQIKQLTDEKLLTDIADFAYKDDELDCYVLLRDGCHFINHSPNPNIESGQGEDYTFASRDIKAGEELYQNYLEYGQLPKPEMMEIFKKYNPCRYEFYMNKTF